jgi:carbon storage regulator CsrA
MGLIIARHENESIEVIFPDMAIGKILVVKGGSQVKLLFDFPNNVRIRRTELQQKIKTTTEKGAIRDKHKSL